MTLENDDVQESTRAQNWTCSKCNSLNHMRRDACWKCGVARILQSSDSVSAHQDAQENLEQKPIKGRLPLVIKFYLPGLLLLAVLLFLHLVTPSSLGLITESDWLEKNGIRTEDQWIAEREYPDDWLLYYSSHQYQVNCLENWPDTENGRLECMQDRAFIDDYINKIWRESRDAREAYRQSQDYFEAQKWSVTSEKADLDTYLVSTYRLHDLTIVVVAILGIPICIWIAKWVAIRVAKWLINGLLGGWIFTVKRIKGREIIIFFAVILFGLIPFALWVFFMILMMLLGTKARRWAEAAMPSKKQCEECKGWNDFAATRCQHCGQVVQATTA